MKFDYDTQTREHYKSDTIAESYHEEFTKAGLSGWRHRFIASRERNAVFELLRSIPHETAIDVPTGTGKMAEIFAKLRTRVTACDVSPNMLAIARQTFETAGCATESFEVVDLERATETLTRRVDAVVCIRLMHRVPDEVKTRMLEQVAKLAPHAIVSFGITSPWQRVRLWLSRTFLGAKAAGRDTHRNMSQTTTLIEKHFQIEKRQPVAPVLSGEWVFLLTPLHN